MNTKPRLNDSTSQEELSSIGDDLLMQQVSLEDDHAAFDQLYHRHAARMGGFFLRMLGHDRDKAQDFTQELFMRLYTSRGFYNPQESFSTWLYSMAYNLCKNEYRHAQVKESYEAHCTATGEVGVEEGTEERIDRSLLKQRMSRAVDSLPVVQREVFILHYIEELPVARVAALVQVPEGTVKSRLYTALARVTEIMKKYK